MYLLYIFIFIFKIQNYEKTIKAFQNIFRNFKNKKKPSCYRMVSLTYFLLLISSRINDFIYPCILPEDCNASIISASVRKFRLSLICLTLTLLYFIEALTCDDLTIKISFNIYHNEKCGSTSKYDPENP